MGIKKRQEVARKRLWQESDKCWRKLNILSQDAINVSVVTQLRTALRALESLSNSLEN